MPDSDDSPAPILRPLARENHLRQRDAVSRADKNMKKPTWNRYLRADKADSRPKTTVRTKPPRADFVELVDPRIDAHSRQRTPAGPTMLHRVQIGRSQRPHESRVSSLGCL